MTSLSRRGLLQAAAAAGVVLATGQPAEAAPGEPGSPDLTPPPGFDLPVALPLPFAHGVASGDPLPDRVVLWTRITVPDPAAYPSVPVTYELGTTPDFTTPVTAGSTTAVPDHDYTVKVDPTGLAAGTTYYYRFRALGRTSVTGRTRTAVATTVAEVRFATVSCASYWSVVAFDGMRKIAERNDLDCVLHAGDHVYDYPDEDEWVRARNGRFDPADVDFRQWRTLAEVRRRYALYYADPDFLRLHVQHPLFVLWDNHDLSRGENDAVSQADVIKAFWEWTPSRPPRGPSLHPSPADQDYVYRALPYGPMADVSCIDVRHIATDAERSAGHLLGADQLSWLTSSMITSKRAGHAWRVLVNGYPFGQVSLKSPVTLPAGNGLLPTQVTTGTVFYGAWDDYPAERARIVQTLRNAGCDDNLIVTGDAHGNVVWDVTDDDTLPAYNTADGKGPTGGLASIGVEMQCSSLGRGGATETIAGDGYRAAHNQSPPYGDRAGFAPYLDAAPAASAALSAALQAANPSIQYFEWDSHGYCILHLTATTAVMEFWKQPIRTSDNSDTLFAQFTVPRGADHPTPVVPMAATSGSRVSAPAPPPVAAADPAGPPPALPESPVAAGLVVAGVAALAVTAVRARSRGAEHGQG